MLAYDAVEGYEALQIPPDDVSPGIVKEQAYVVIAGQYGPMPIHDESRHAQNIECSEEFRALSVNHNLHVKILTQCSGSIKREEIES